MHKFITHSSRVALLAAVLGVGLFTGTADAATTYTGKDPATSGCATDATTVGTSPIKNPSGGVLGTIDLRYSVTCHAAWARITLPTPLHICSTVCPSWGPQRASAVVHRNSDGVEETVTVDDGNTTAWTNMVDDQGVTSYAKGTVFLDSSSDGTGTATTIAY